MVSGWCPDGVPIVSRWCPDGVPIVSRWCPDRVPMASRRRVLFKVIILSQEKSISTEKTWFYVENLWFLHKTTDYQWYCYQTWRNHRFLKDFSWFRKISHDFAWFRTILHDFERFRLISYDFGRFHIFFNRFHTISNDFAWFRMISHDFERFRLISYDFERFRMISNDLTWFLCFHKFRRIVSRSCPDRVQMTRFF